MKVEIDLDTANGVAVAYLKDCLESLEHLPDWMTETKEDKEHTRKTKKHIRKVLEYIGPPV